MKIIQEKFYQVYSDYDRDTTVVANFYIESVAKEFVKNQPNQFLYVDLVEVELIIYDSISDYNENSMEAIRKRAMGKLSREEIIALGLK